MCSWRWKSLNSTAMSKFFVPNTGWLYLLEKFGRQNRWLKFKRIGFAGIQIIEDGRLTLHDSLDKLFRFA
ncbi:hypothetical protein AAKU67_001697 [Oxalobacteraceae bacterium GrIS 2.11]